MADDTTLDENQAGTDAGTAQDNTNPSPDAPAAPDAGTEAPATGSEEETPAEDAGEGSEEQAAPADGAEQESAGEDAGEGSEEAPAAPAEGEEESASEDAAEGQEEDLSQQVGGTASNIAPDGTVSTAPTDPNLTDAPEGGVDESDTNDETQTTEKPGGSNVVFHKNQIVLITRNNRTDRGTVVAQHGEKLEVVVGSNPEVHTVWAAQVTPE